MARFTPFMEHRSDEPIAAHPDITGADDQVMGFSLVDPEALVGRDAIILVVPFGEQQADGAFRELRQVAIDEPRVLASELDLTTEGEIVADEHGSTSDDPSRKRLVVGISEPQHPAIVLTGLLSVDFHEAEVASAVVSERVRLRADGQLRGGECALDGLNELMMWDRLPR